MNDAYLASLHLLHVIEDPFAGAVYMGMATAPPEGISNISISSRAPVWRRC